MHRFEASCHVIKLFVKCVLNVIENIDIYCLLHQPGCFE